MDSNNYKVLEINQYGGEVKLNTRALKPSLLPNECLIRVHVATIHPADMFFINGFYGAVQPDVFPIVPGFEGSGEIVEVGERVEKSNIGKRVCLTQNSNKKGEFQGIWGEYTYCPFESCIVFDDKIPYENIAFSFVNPLTVCGFLDTVRKSNVKAIVQTAAFSTVGKMVIRLFSKEKDVKTINLVRKAEQVQVLKDLGADYVINTTEKNWEQELTKLSHELRATMCFECIGGDIGAKILTAMPYGSTLFNYGNLTFIPMGKVSSSDLIFQDKKVQGWWLGTWLNRLSAEERVKWFGLVVKEIFTGSDLFRTQTSKKFTFENFNEAFAYYKDNMSEGKIILCPKF